MLPAFTVKSTKPLGVTTQNAVGRGLPMRFERKVGAQIFPQAKSNFRPQNVEIEKKSINLLFFIYNLGYGEC